jgi:ribonuclease HI
MDKDHATIFTDGSSLGNPGPGGWSFVMVYENNTVVYAKEGAGYSPQTTNNIMELTAALEAITLADKINIEQPLLICTDSAYLVNGITTWVYGWEKNNWITSTKDPVLNRELWIALLAAVRKFQIKNKIVWKKIKGHAGILGNERCDILATTYAAKKETILFQGTYDTYVEKYGDILHIPKVVEKSKKKTPSGKAYSYLSEVGGVIEKHESWAECEKRVRGVKGVRYKKAMTAKEEKEIITKWKS